MALPYKDVAGAGPSVRHVRTKRESDDESSQHFGQGDSSLLVMKLNCSSGDHMIIVGIRHITGSYNYIGTKRRRCQTLACMSHHGR